MIAKKMEFAEVLISKVHEEIEDDKPWYYDLKNFLEDQSFLKFPLQKIKRES